MITTPITRKPVVTWGELGVLGFTTAYMAVSLFAAFQKHNSEFVFYFAVMCVLIVAVSVLQLQVKLPIAALWGLSLWGLVHMAGGLLPIPHSWPSSGKTHVLYNLWLVPRVIGFDQLVHAYGFGLVTWICWQALERAFVSRGIRVMPTFGLLTLCVAAGMGFGAMNEVVEYIVTLTLPNTNVGGYDNTGRDLIANAVGTVAVATLIKMRFGNRSAVSSTGGEKAL